MHNWRKSGTPWIWLSAGAVSISLIMVIGLLLLIASRGLVHFWPANVTQLAYQTGPDQTVQLIGELKDRETLPMARLLESGTYVHQPEGELGHRQLLKTGNRDHLGLDFRWIVDGNILQQSRPPELMVIERREWGNFYGYLRSVSEGGVLVAEGDASWSALQKALGRSLELFDEIRKIEKKDIGQVNYALEQLRLKQRKLELNDQLTPDALAKIDDSRAEQEAAYQLLMGRLAVLYREIGRDSVTAELMDGTQVEVPLSTMVRVYQPNAMNLPRKIGHYLSKAWEFVSDEPREANTEGGVFPAIFGTVLMVLIMSLMATPLGVVAAIYLHEYATQGWLTRTIRIAVNNLAGVPSIVYGVFGLGFFVYFLGGNLDALFYPERLPAPTFGTPGMMWASLTLALMTLPVVIVSTEEGLSRIPSSIREGSLALGATKAETLWRTVLPMASPAVMTGMILAIARAAGEVAPLMLVGVVKLAPSLAIDGNAPFLHLERKFMHLGFHIYDVGFQSPNVEAARPLVYATALLLVLVILVLNITAITIRNRLREKHRLLET
ncbi:MAG: phosphate ABC transporter permease PstA [Gammaproteobacteria bacterium]|nr:phosphate ABC transporter permease PstA [Gammaproteobacteria bacterium]